MSTHLQENKSAFKNPYLAITVLLCCLLEIFRLRMSNLTAYEWPGLDMFPFFEHQLNSSILKNDFFTQASLTPNPRHVYGWFVLYLSDLLGKDYYQILLGFKVIHNLLVPLLYMMLIGRVLELRLGRLSLWGWLASGILSFCATFFTISSWMSVAWWPPLTLVVSPQTVTQTIVMIGLVLYLYVNRSWAEYLCYILLVIGGLIHPVIGMITAVFFVLLTWGIFNWLKAGLILLFGALIPSLALVFLFRSEIHLTGKELQTYYAWLHLGHYIPSKYHGDGILAWWQSFSVVTMVSATITVLLKRQKSTLWMPIGLLTLAYVGAMATQYLFVEVLPIGAVIKIGPSRFLQFGYWIMGIGLIALLEPFLGRTNYISQALLRLLPPQRALVSWSLGLSATLAICLLYLLPRKADDPWKRLGEQPIYQFFANKTANDAVVCAPPEQIRINLPIISHRAVMCCNGFPFSEDYMVEHYKRFTSIYGAADHLFKSDEPDLLTNAKTWYQKQNRSSLKAALMPYRVDYIVVYTDMEPQFSGITPLYKDDTYMVYRRTDL